MLIFCLTYFNEKQIIMNYKKHFGRSLMAAILLSGALAMNAQSVTYQFKNVPLKTVLKEVEKQQSDFE